jgi:hypothetical protein
MLIVTVMFNRQIVCCAFLCAGSCVQFDVVLTEADMITALGILSLVHFTAVPPQSQP